MYRLFPFLVLLWLPVSQGIFHFVQEPKLRGEVSAAVKDISFGLGSYLDGSLQENLSAQLSNFLGFKKISIKVNNSINAFIFGEYHSTSGTGVIIGKDRELFEKGPVLAYKQSALVPQPFLEEKVKKIEAVSTWLKRNNVELILLISPSKVAANPEALPSEWELHRGYKETSSYKRMLELLEGTDVTILDSPKFLKQVEARRGIPMYPKTGTHWNYVAACEVASKLSLMIDKLLPEITPKVVCGDAEASRKPKGDDDNLLDIMNVFFKQKFYPEQFHYPHTFHDKNGANKTPNVLIVGSSYIWQLLRIIDKHELYKPLDFYYYFTRHHRDGVGLLGYVDRSPEGLRTDLLSRDVIIVETNEVVLAQAGFEFFEHVYPLLEP